MDHEFSRGGTAPNKVSKNQSSNRARPKTRGVSTVASELADLNMALKLEKHVISPPLDDHSSDLFDDYQSAIDSWEQARKVKTPIERAQPQSRKPNSAYTGADPVTAAYSSQFKPIKSSNSRGSPRITASKAKAVAEIQAAYGMADQQRPTSQQGKSDSTKRKTNKNSAQIIGEERLISQSRDSSLGKFDHEKDGKKYSPSSEILSSGDASSERASTTNSIPSNHLSPSLVHTSNPSANTELRRRSLDESAIVEPQPPHRARPPQSQLQPSQPPSNDGKGSGSYRKRVDQTRANSASGTCHRREEASKAPPVRCVDPPLTAASPYSHLTPEPNPAIALLVDTSGPDLLSESDYQGGGIGGTHLDMEVQRPQSRKLYLGQASHISPRPVMADTNSTPDHHSEKTTERYTRAPRSAGGLARQQNQLSPDGDPYAEGLLPSHSTAGEIPSSHVPLTHTISSGVFGKPAAPWHGTVVNYDERPPSRQKTAFPIHLADTDLKEKGSSNTSGRPSGRGVEIKRAAFVENEPTVAIHDQAPMPSRMVKMGSSDLILESPLGRPPSRQRIAAQYLWDEDNLYDPATRNVSNVMVDPYYTEDTGKSTPSLLSGVSAVSLGLADPDDYNSFGNNANANNQRMQSRGDKAKTAGDSGSLGPMYDPAADGFTQLDNRSQSAPFKIRVCSMSLFLSPPPSNSLDDFQLTHSLLTYIIRFCV
jgi:hypothetical protein